MADQPAVPGIVEAVWTAIAAAILGAAELFRRGRQSSRPEEPSVASVFGRLAALERAHEEQLSACSRRMQELEPIVRRVTTSEALIPVISSRLDRLEAAVADLPERIYERLRG